MKIKDIKAEEILDSRGNPTIIAYVYLEDGSIGWAAVPSGASTGKYEAVELRDNDPKRYHGLGVQKAILNIHNKILPALIDVDASEQKVIDEIMINLDNSPNKANLGANAILAVSLAVARAESNAQKIPLYQYLTQFNPDFDGNYIIPIPQCNVLNGGKHGDWATDIQEYMLMPIGADSVTEGVRMCSEVYQNLKEILKENGYSIGLGDEGGFAPKVKSNTEPFELLSLAIQRSGYILGSDICFATDPAASEFYSNGKYILKTEDKKLAKEELLKYYSRLNKKYPIISWEDPFSEDDWESFTSMTRNEGNNCQIVGDDLYATNVSRLERGIKEKASNSILIKLNQIGTLTEAVDAILLARRENLTSVVSHRSGETEDSFISDFGVAMGVGQMKIGSVARSDRTVKYNRLMHIERELGEQASYANFPF